MPLNVRTFRPFFLLALLLATLTALSACASKKNDYTARTNPFPYNVADIEVTSLDPAGDEFAKQLKFNLEQSMGGPSINAAQKVRLYVQTHPNGALDKSTKSLFRQITSLGGTSVTATVRLMDYDTGGSVEYEQITSSSSKDDIRTANLYIAEDMVSQIRAIAGLTSYPPRPIPFEEEPKYPNVPTPASETAKLVFKPNQQMADPLLNGQITSDTKAMDLMKKVQELDDAAVSEAKVMKKKVNTEAKMVRDALMEKVPTPKEPMMRDKDKPSEMPLAENISKETMMDLSEAKLPSEADEDLCIVTVENDCLGVTGAN